MVALPMTVLNGHRSVTSLPVATPAQALPGQTTPDGVPAFKLVLVGDGGTGQYQRGVVGRHSS